MTQQQTLQLFLPVLIVLPVLYFRMRRTAKAQPLKLGRLWIRPALIIAAAALVLFLPQPGQHGVRHLATQDWLCLALAAGLGGVAGWHWGRTMAIEVHPEDGTLMVTGGQMAILVLIVLILFRTGLRAGVAAEAEAWHLDALLISDALIVFSAALFTLRSVEMYIRAKRVMLAQ
jgi:drug/metabolite transporter (DMT)-like permease